MISPSEFHDLLESLSLADLEAMLAGQRDVVQKRIALGIPLDGAGDRLITLAEFIQERKKKQGEVAG